jgi:hypothetical protein
MIKKISLIKANMPKQESEHYKEIEGLHTATEPTSPFDAEETPHPLNEGAFDIELKPTRTISGVVSARGADIKWTAEFPEDLAYEGLAGFVPGFGGFKGTSRPPRRAHAQAGAATFSYAPLRESDASLVENLFHAQDAHVATIAAVVDAIPNHPDLHTMPNSDRIDFDRLWIVDHSMGKGAGTPFAIANAGRVEGITDLATIGYGTPTLRHFLCAFPQGVIPGLYHELLPLAKSGHINPDLRSIGQALYHYARNFPRTVGEAYSCLTLDLREATALLGELGVRTSHIGFEFDSLVQPHKSQASEYVEAHGVLKGMGHLAPQLKAPLVARHVIRVMQTGKFDETDELMQAA